MPENLPHFTLILCVIVCVTFNNVWNSIPVLLFTTYMIYDWWKKFCWEMNDYLHDSKQQSSSIPLLVRNSDKIFLKHLTWKGMPMRAYCNIMTLCSLYQMLLYYLLVNFPPCAYYSSFNVFQYYLSLKTYASNFMLEIYNISLKEFGVNVMAHSQITFYFLINISRDLGFETCFSWI